MRIQNTVPVVVVSMARKKHKNHQSKQQQENQEEQNNHESLEEQDDSSNLQGLRHCCHINRSVNVAVVQKFVRRTPLGQCTACPSAEVKNSLDSNVSSTEQPDIYLCLQCANQGCDRTAPGHHALNHYQTAHSSPHDIAVNLSTLAVWCYACDEFVNGDVSRKLKECVDWIRRFNAPAKKTQPQLAASSSSLAGDAVDKEFSVSSTKQQSGPVSSKQTQSACYKVKGLANLGNTCFFNAVLQNLCQTYLLDQELREWTKKGYSVDLFASGNSEAGEISSDDDCDQQKKLDHLTIRLAECGPLTQSVLSLFDEVASSATVKQRNYVSPSGLFNQVCHKAPRFKGFQQQDSHELLRYLLDGMKAEEIKRAQVAILKAFNLSENQPAKDLPNEKKLKIKEYGRLSKHTFVDRIFGGIFVSTVVCQVCRVPTQMFEPFLDVSLPIADEKTVSQMGKSLLDVTGVPTVSRVDNDVSADRTTSADKQTKNQIKRQQKQARKQKKKAPVKIALESENSNAATHDVNNAAESSESLNDAVVEYVGAADADGSTEPAVISNVVQFKVDRVENDHGDLVDERNVGPDEEDDDEDDDDIKDEGLQRSTTMNDFERSDGATVCRQNEEESVDAVATLLNEMDLESQNQTNGTNCDENLTDCQPEFNNALFDLTGNENNGNSSLNVQTSGKPSGTLELADCTSGHIGQWKTLNNEIGNTDVAVDHNGKANETSEQLLSDCNSYAEHSNVTDRDAVSLPRGEPDILNGETQRVETNASTDCAVEGQLNCNGHPVFNNGHCTTAAGDAVGDDTSDRNKKATKMERRRRAMLAAMETAGIRQKPSARECSLHSCLLQFTAVEILSGSNMLACSECNSAKQRVNEVTSEGNSGGGQKTAPILSNANKQLLIYTPPAILTLHLKRFQQIGYNLRKNTQHVEFTELLDLAPYCSALCEKTRRTASGQAQILYSLYGVIEHSGTLRSGHYTAYVKVRSSNPDARQFLQSLHSSNVSVSQLVNQMQTLGVEESSVSSSVGSLPASEGRWYHISDTSVSEVKNIENVLNCQAYILFYERLA